MRRCSRRHPRPSPRLLLWLDSEPAVLRAGLLWLSNDALRPLSLPLRIREEELGVFVGPDTEGARFLLAPPPPAWPPSVDTVTATTVSEGPTVGWAVEPEAAQAAGSALEAREGPEALAAVTANRARRQRLETTSARASSGVWDSGVHSNKW